ncbi:MAG: hypothetical protein A2729_02415 [Candidatus Buchananbacteria bacterium RIFCSPHIGHO2_01_FULL_39_14]|uniref:Uncharacterized protein n=2 Tax=Candidatus Buchananiibacteriota TaxID=1817903 RepID=A0A1G1YR47_9BACT|nr:MAG: hypothetical protein A2729_02415 [Candidatus Buchananbacteria bacterium RIFCSPHIGHO2_01_FULL_39_14]OGY48589.1 MAG: hypothetical protein A3D39_01925 [Candidatus Buchananbacteria bacterium RIFCSPHIGHO2_02_FULL_39_17]OGY53907.1 MAG: hypothetical protein A2912_04960 [Candidatus Buchananbacteria bacterium RIFCSPLOWO2_01_FULL_40_23b]
MAKNKNKIFKIIWGINYPSIKNPKSKILNPKSRQSRGSSVKPGQYQNPNIKNDFLNFGY